MRGNNSLTLNQATMIEIVQEWIDRNIPSKPLRVTQVGVSTRTTGSATEFTVDLAERVEAEK